MISSKDQLISSYYDKRGASAEEKQDYVKAIASYQKALQYNTDQIDARLGLCRAYIAKNDYNAAEQAYLEGIENEPDKAEFYIGLSSVYVKQNKFQEASELLNNIKSAYVRTKIGSLRPKPPELSPLPGRYDKRIQIEMKSTSENTSYYTIGESKDAQPFCGELPLNNGHTEISAFSVSKEGLVSDIVKGEYILEKIVERAYFNDPGVEAMARAALNKPIRHIYDR